MSDFKITDEMIEAASVETERLSRELDITNADHIVLWLESNLGPAAKLFYSGAATVGYLACRIVEAHEAELATLRAQNAALIEKMTAIEHSMRMASLPGNDWKREISLSTSLARNALAQVAK